MDMALERKPSNASVVVRSEQVEKSLERSRKRLSPQVMGGEKRLGELSMAKILRTRVRYFSDGAVIGSKEFVNEAFTAARERFSKRRKDGARKMRGAGKEAGGQLWSVRDLRVEV